MNAIATLKNGVSFVRNHLAMLTVAVVLCLAGSSAYAQEDPPGVTVQDIMSPTDFTDLIDSIGSKTGTVVKAAIGLSVGLFIVGFLYRILRKYTSRGA